MANQQQRQKKAAWQTPMIVVLTPGSDQDAGVLRSCKKGSGTLWVYSNHDGCNGWLWSKCNVACQDRPVA